MREWWDCLQIATLGIGMLADVIDVYKAIRRCCIREFACRE